jgi:hypothetical protein
MELSHVLISRVAGQRSSDQLAVGFTLYVLVRLPYGGFVLDSEGTSLAACRECCRGLRAAGAPATVVRTAAEALRPRKDRCLNIDHSPLSSKLRPSAAPRTVVIAGS